MTRKERQEARAERYREYADNADKRATAAFNASSAAVEHIPSVSLFSWDIIQNEPTAAPWSVPIAQ